MPLLDHFNPPLNRTHPWRSFHGAWAAAMARLLNQGVLPPGYYAVPLVDRDGPIEIDVAALREHETPAAAGRPRRRPGRRRPPAWRSRSNCLAADGVEVQVFADDGDPRLAAAVELVSPRNKDRPQARQAFAVKCVGYLQQGSSVVVVDTVTTRRADLNAAILSFWGSMPCIRSNAVEPLGGVLPSRRPRRGNATAPALAGTARPGAAPADPPPVDRLRLLGAPRPGSQLPGDVHGPTHPSSGVTARQDLASSPPQCPRRISDGW